MTTPHEQVGLYALDLRKLSNWLRENRGTIHPNDLVRLRPLAADVLKEVEIQHGSVSDGFHASANQ